MHMHVHPAPSPTSKIKSSFTIAIALILIFAGIEAFFGWQANSLALLGDAGHMVSDAIALGIAAFAAWLAKKPPSHRHSYGLGRAEVVAAWISSLLMLVISIAVIVEAITRIHAPRMIQGNIVMIVATLGMITNIFVAWLISRETRTLNTRAAMLHIFGDLLGSIAALMSGAVIFFTKWTLIDPILSILIGLLILYSSLQLLRESLQVLMEAVPSHLDAADILGAMQAIEHVIDVHDFHLWTLSSGSVALSAHISLDDMALWSDILTKQQTMLADRYAIDHITLQPEASKVSCQGCEPI